VSVGDPGVAAPAGVAPSNAPLEPTTMTNAALHHRARPTCALTSRAPKP
jgi:hypothetical protein